MEDPQAKTRRLGSPKTVPQNLTIETGQWEEFEERLRSLDDRTPQTVPQSDVLIAGLGGLGAEVAKNLVLSGVKSLTLLDSKAANYTDLSSQFSLSASSLGVNRAEACRSALAELNSSVVVNVITSSLVEDILENFKIVILTDSLLHEQSRICYHARSKGIKIILASTFGLFGQIFCDLGDHFTTLMETTGEIPPSVSITSISQDSDGVVVIDDKKGHGFQDGDYVQFSEVKGMTELNDGKPYKIENLGPYSFSIGDTSKFSAYKGGGVATRIKIEKKALPFKPFSHSLFYPKFTIIDLEKMDRPKQFHIMFQALHAFMQQNNRAPQAGVAEDAEKFQKLCSSLKGDVELDDELIQRFANACCGNLAPINAIIGGIAAQQVMIGLNGKFHPIYQWLYYDALECLPLDWAPSEDDVEPLQSRYDGQISVFGRAFQETLQKLHYFVVGAGEVGCELLKNFALMGIGCEKAGGEIIVTDMNIISKADLNQHFLFRPDNVNQPKAEVAVKGIKCINPELNVVAHNYCVENDTKEIYDDVFFDRLDGVANTSNKNDSRLFINERCMINRKPLLQLETLGIKGKIQVVVPFLTESYTSQEELPSQFISLCTLKYFPHAAEHALYWAQELFDELFKEGPLHGAQYLEDPEFLDRTLRLRGLQPVVPLETVFKTLVKDRPRTIEECVTWARSHWDEQFCVQIQQLLRYMPPDHLDETGYKFWSAPKKCPHPIYFNVENSLHIDYVFAAANLKAKVYGIPQQNDRKAIIKIIKDIHDSGMLREISEPGTSSTDSTDSDPLKLIRSKLPSREKLLMENFKIRVLKFDADDDDNFHMDFIVAASNLRAINYDIPPMDRIECGRIVGKTMPPVPTTTSVVAGFACLELIKIAQRYTNLDAYNNVAVNLTLPSFTFSPPLPAPKMKYNDTEWTTWDNFEVQGELTLDEFLLYFKHQLDLEVTMISHENSILHSFTWNSTKWEELKVLTISELVEKELDKKLKPHVRSLILELLCKDKKGEAVAVPYVRYVLPPQP